MRIAIPLIGLGLALQGCIIYDHDCPGCDPDRVGEGIDGRPDRDDDTGCEEPCDDDPDDTGEEELPPPPDYGLFLTPDEAEQGEIFIASLRADGEDELDLATVTELRIFGDVEILASDARSSEILLTVRVAPDAATGPVDLLAELDDGTATFEEGVLEIFPLGSGHQAGSSDDGSDPCE
jgi:hypothetical protein